MIHREEQAGPLEVALYERFRELRVNVRHGTTARALNFDAKHLADLVAALQKLEQVARLLPVAHAA